MGDGERKTKRVRIVPLVCNILGTLILAAAIVMVVPATVPRYFGYGIYNVETGSMAPELPVGSIVYVKETDPADVAEGDIIAFENMGAVVTHRVVKNRLVEGEFVTKGDANEEEDPWTVKYDQMIGRVEHHFPVLGTISTLFADGIGKLYLLGFAACGAMLNLLAARLRE